MGTTPTLPNSRSGSKIKALISCHPVTKNAVTGFMPCCNLVSSRISRSFLFLLAHQTMKIRKPTGTKPNRQFANCNIFLTSSLLGILHIVSFFQYKRTILQKKLTQPSTLSVALYATSLSNLMCFLSQIILSFLRFLSSKIKKTQISSRGS